MQSKDSPHFSSFILSLDNVELKSYEPNFNGFLQSWIDRFPDTNIDDILERCYESNKKYFD